MRTGRREQVEQLRNRVRQERKLAQVSPLYRDSHNHTATLLALAADRIEQDGQLIARAAAEIAKGEMRP